MSLWLIAPEIGITALALLLLALDLIFLRAKNKGWLGWVGALGIAALVVLLGSLHHMEGYFGTGYLIDSFSFIFKLIILLVAGICCLVSVGFVNRQLTNPGEFFALLLFSTLGLMIMVSANDLLLLYLGLELGTISLYALAALQKNRPRSGEAGLKFLIMGAISSAVFLYGASLLYGSLGTTVYPEMQFFYDNLSPLLIIGLVMVIAALGFKITAVPFHMWAPDVYQGAPTPVTGFLSVASKAAGFAALLRLFMGPLFLTQSAWLPLFMSLSFLSMVVGNLLAIPQANIKRMLAYSGIAQAGYLLIALSAGSERGVAAAIFFLFQYAFTNFGAFIVVTLVGSARGNDKISSYAGLSRRNPLLALSLLILLLSLGGIPPLSGFWGKLFLFWAGIDKEFYGLVLVAVLATVLSLYYYLMVARQMYIEEPGELPTIKVPFSSGLALAICTLMVVVLSYPKPWLMLAQAAARMLGLPS